MPPVSRIKESAVVPDKVPLTIVDAAPNVIGPVHLLIFLIFFMAPWLVELTITPFPLIVMGSGIFKLVPSIWIVVPATMVVAPAIAPNAALFFASITPALNVVKPVKVLVPPNIRVSLLNLFNPPDPEMTASIRIPLLTSVVKV